MENNWKEGFGLKILQMEYTALLEYIGENIEHFVGLDIGL